MRRIVSLWLPRLATDRLRRTPPADPAIPPDIPLATRLALKGGERLIELDAAAEAAGLYPGQTVGEARARAPRLRTVPADPRADRQHLEQLAAWCRRYTPWTALDTSHMAGDGSDAGGGLWLDVTGCAHLFGGERELLDDLAARLARGGLTARLALADTPGAAWAFARYGEATVTLCPEGAARQLLAGLPAAALRLDARTLDLLDRLGLRRIDDLLAQPRAPLTKRAGPGVAWRLDQALGRQREPISPAAPPPQFRTRIAFPEPIGHSEDVAAALDRLLAGLCDMLARHGRGARRLELVLYRTDGTTETRRIGTARPNRDAAHLARLFAGKLDGIDAGFGIELMLLAATAVDAQGAEQLAAAGAGRAQTALDGLIDRLAGRLGADAVTYADARESHLPERACVPGPPEKGPPRADPGDIWRAGRRRPVRLLDPPEEIAASAPVPDAPPVLIRWRRRAHRIAAAEGPERLAAEWWRAGTARPEFAGTRDYYRIEDERGLRFWVFRAGAYGGDAPPRWYLHGLFA
jgi:protein ImuB